MPPQETTHLLTTSERSHGKGEPQPPGILSSQFSFGTDESSSNNTRRNSYLKWVVVAAGTTTLLLLSLIKGAQSYREFKATHATGPYKLIQLQTGKDFFGFYDFLDGPDSLGSAGYNVYVGEKRALELNLMNVTRETTTKATTTGSSSFTNIQEQQQQEEVDYIYLKSAPTQKGPRESLRLEGKRRFDRGLFVLDLQHMPAGCGMWPAFWLTDEPAWPDNGEIDVVEGINGQSVAKTALHTSESCSMYGTVSPFDKTGVWDSATGIPNTWTGKLDFDTKVEADNCWVMAPHQWANQGCVAVSTDNTTLGEPLNAQGGGVYVLEWDPAAGYIKSWVFTANNGGVPSNLQAAMRSADDHKKSKKTVVVRPDPATWDVLPYAYFAIGERSGCSADHFKNMRLIFNLAFCGTVAGNRFERDCPVLAQKFGYINTTTPTSDPKENKVGTKADPVEACNAYIKSNPAALEEAYWKIRGVYVYERE